MGKLKKLKAPKEIEELFSSPKEKELLQNILIEHENFEKTSIPRCIKCKTDMINCVDSVTGKINKSIWKYDCDCIKDKNIRLGTLG